MQFSNGTFITPVPSSISLFSFGTHTNVASAIVTDIWSRGFFLSVAATAAGDCEYIAQYTTHF